MRFKRDQSSIKDKPNESTHLPNLEAKMSRRERENAFIKKKYRGRWKGSEKEQRLRRTNKQKAKSA
jgi:hypothetical protein